MAHISHLDSHLGQLSHGPRDLRPTGNSPEALAQRLRILEVQARELEKQEQVERQHERQLQAGRDMADIILQRETEQQQQQRLAAVAQAVEQRLAKWREQWRLLMHRGKGSLEFCIWLQAACLEAHDELERYAEADSIEVAHG